jgi:hexosaminidase
MKHIVFVMLLTSCFSLLQAKQKSVTPPVSITWEMGKNGIEPGILECTFYIKNTGKETLKDNWVIYYTIMTVVPINTKNAPLKMERIVGSFHKMAPTEHFKPLKSGETLRYACRYKGSIIREARAPESAYIVFLDKKGKEKEPQNIALTINPFTKEEQYKRPGKDYPYADGAYLYDQNAFFSQHIKPAVTDIFPSVKKILNTPGTARFTTDVTLKWDAGFENEAGLLKNALISKFGCSLSPKGNTEIELKKLTGEYPKEYYEISMMDNRFILSGKTAHGVFNACQTLINLLGNVKGLPAEFNNMQISDYPDADYRGFMLDVARNFTKKHDLLRLIDMLSAYKINVLHMHLTDDEGWRIEIPGLDELTGIASRRGHTTDESTCLYPMYGSGRNPNDTTSPANGYYTRNDFIEILRYADKHHIKVIPEVDIPGHSRAAIKAMNARYNKYISTDKVKAQEYLLIDFADTSKYVSAQHYTDNVINVAMPSAYRFIEKVIDEIDKMYSDAGLKLDIFHIGGDEVPRGAWEGSLVCKKFMKEKGMTEIRELKDYFLEQVIPMLSKKDIQPAGWEEVAMKPGHKANERFRNSNILSYTWNTAPEWNGDEITYKLANAGYPVILCNVSNFYLDLTYCNHQQEDGLNWGGYVNEYNSFDMIPYDIYKSVRKNKFGEPVDIFTADNHKIPLNNEAKGQIKGLQGQLWSETIRSFDQIGYYLFPKMFGLIERAWNVQPEWSRQNDNNLYESAIRKYNAQIADLELPRLASEGFNFRVAPPGIVVKEGILYANTTIPGAAIRYTTDGTEPNEQSPKWTKPVSCDAKILKAKAYYLGKSSITISQKQ